MICETATLTRVPRRGNVREQTFGAYAYFILSDGKEAATSIILSFGNSGSDENVPAAAEPNRADDPLSRDAWQAPGAAVTIAEAGKGEFRLRFNSQAWSDKLGSAQVLSDQKISALE